MVKMRSLSGRWHGQGRFVRRNHVAIIGRHQQSLPGKQLAGDILHFRVLANSGRIGFQLRNQITPIQPRQPGRAIAISFPGKPMAGDARSPGAAGAPAQRHQLAVLVEQVGIGWLRDIAGRQKKSRQQDPQHGFAGRSWRIAGHLAGTARRLAGSRRMTAMSAPRPGTWHGGKRG